MSGHRDELFRCDRFVSQFPVGMTRRACLRRQDERRDILDDKGETIGSEPVYTWCALECSEGRVTRTLLGGATPAPTPPEPALLKPAPSTRLWEPGAVPDVPIGGPPATSEFTGYRPLPSIFTGDAEGIARGMRRAREQASRKDDGEEQDQPPAQPAEEDEMPRGKRDAPWPCCGSKSTRHLKTCAEYGKATATKALETKPAPEKKFPSARLLKSVPTSARPATLPPPWQREGTPTDSERLRLGLPALTDDELLSLRDEVSEELRRRLAAAEAAVAKLREAAAA